MGLGGSGLRVRIADGRFSYHARTLESDELLGPHFVRYAFNSRSRMLAGSGHVVFDQLGKLPFLVASTNLFAAGSGDQGCRDGEDGGGFPRS